MIVGAYAVLVLTLPDQSEQLANDRSPIGASAYLAAGLALFGAGVVAWVNWPDRIVGFVAILAGGTWFGPIWRDWRTGPDVVRGIGAILTPLALPLLVAVVATATERRLSTPVRRSVLAYAVLAAVLGIGQVLTYSAFDDPTCTISCGRDNPLLVISVDSVAAMLETLWLATSALACLALAGRASIRLARARGRWRRSISLVLASGVAVGVTSALACAVVLFNQAAPASGPDALEVTPWQSLAVTVLAVTIASLALETNQLAASIRRLAASVEISPTPGSFETGLAETLGDDSLRVGYWLPESSRFVDAAGEPFVLAGGDATQPSITLERAGQPIAMIVHDVSLDGSIIEAEIGPAATLAIDNERLAAASRAQLIELQASRSRIVSTGDAARRRLERDLHDGAQQQLLAVLLQIRLAHDAATRAGDLAAAERLATAEAEAHLAFDDLRDLAHGIFPAVLAESGLGPALLLMAETAPIPVVVSGSTPEDRCAPSVEMAAYQLAVDTVRLAGADGASSATIRLARGANGLTIEINDDGPAVIELPVGTRDRVGAAGGMVEIRHGGPAGSLVRAVLPCG